MTAVDTTPMTRTELAMLWDLLGTWKTGHAAPEFFDERRCITVVRDAIDVELAERFGG